MFKYISKILEQFTISQKIVALFMLLLSITTIIIAPSLISSIILNRDELNSEIENQNIKIKELKSDIDSLEYKIRKNEKECTNQILLRE
jgi:peptidoglycan hydrolase CwlO-like protein